MLNDWLRSVWSGCESFDKVRIRVVAWFVRLAWLPALVWGCIDLALSWTQPLSSTAAREREEDAAISLGLGSALFLVWLFMYRRRGPWTLNKGGKLER
jgi:hypothetical protein